MESVKLRPSHACTWKSGWIWMGHASLKPALRCWDAELAWRPSPHYQYLWLLVRKATARAIFRIIHTIHCPIFAFQLSLPRAQQRGILFFFSLTCSGDSFYKCEMVSEYVIYVEQVWLVFQLGWKKNNMWWLDNLFCLPSLFAHLCLQEMQSIDPSEKP